MSRSGADLLQVDDSRRCEVLVDGEVAIDRRSVPPQGDIQLHHVGFLQAGQGRAHQLVWLTGSYTDLDAVVLPHFRHGLVLDVSRIADTDCQVEISLVPLPPDGQGGVVLDVGPVAEVAIDHWLVVRLPGSDEAGADG